MHRMYYLGRLLCGLIFFALSGCVNYAPLDAERRAIISAGLIEGNNVALQSVPFFPQESYQCGPAALASMLNNAGAIVTPEQLAEEVYVPARQGSLQPFMVAAVRKRNLLPYVREREGLVPLIKELKSGKPVLVLQNLGLAQLPNWHYAIVVGWEPNTQTFILRSGKNAEQKHSLKFFEYTWRASGYWALTVYSPGEIPIQPQLQSWLNSAAGLEAASQWQAALDVYRAIEQQFPNEFLAVMGQGNAAYQLQRYSDAEMAYRKALTLTDKPYGPAHNLAWALIRQNKLNAAREFAKQAKALGGSAYQSAWDALNQQDM